MVKNSCVGMPKIMETMLYANCWNNKRKDERKTKIVKTEEFFRRLDKCFSHAIISLRQHVDETSSIAEAVREGYIWCEYPAGRQCEDQL